MGISATRVPTEGVSGERGSISSSRLIQQPSCEIRTSSFSESTGSVVGRARYTMRHEPFG